MVWALRSPTPSTGTAGGESGDAEMEVEGPLREGGSCWEGQWYVSTVCREAGLVVKQLRENRRERCYKGTRVVLVGCEGWMWHLTSVWSVDIKGLNRMSVA